MGGRLPSILFVLITLCFSMLMSSTVAANEQLYSEAQRLISNNKPEQAYQLLRQNASGLRGDPQYDLLLGIAALDAGHPSQAVFALERVIANQPNNARAQAELGRAYFMLGENEAAKSEFEMLKNTRELPSSVAKSVDEFLTAIRARVAGEEYQTDIYLEVGIGYDSNVNSATDVTELAIPAFNNLLFTLNNNARERDSTLFMWGAGMDIAFPVNDRLSAFASAKISQKNPVDASPFSQNIARGKAGLRYSLDNKNQILGSLGGQRFALDGDANQELASATLQWLHRLNDRTQVSSYTQFSAIRYPDQPLRDVNQYTIGANVAHVLPMQGSPIFSAGIYVGTEDEQENRDDLSKDFIGLRASGQYSYNERTILFANASYQYADYGDDDPFFLKTREDHSFNIGAGIGYSVTDHISITPEIRYYNNDSNIQINEFDRWEALIKARYTF